MKVLVTGGRDFADKPLVHDTLDALSDWRPIDYLIEGGATGADAFARTWAKLNLTPESLLTCPADWDTYGNHAGRVRNAHMLREHRPDLVVAFAGGRGTRHMVTIAEEANIPVIYTWQRGALDAYFKEQGMKSNLAPVAPWPTAPTFADYEAIRAQCGWDKDHGMVEAVWSKLEKHAKRHMMDQYRRMLQDNEVKARKAAQAIEAERALRGASWGAF